MQLLLLLALLFSLVVATFAVQNSMAVEVKFLAWHFRTYLVVVIFASAVLGASAVGLIGLVKQVGLGWRLRNSTSKAGKLEAEVESLKKERDSLSSEVARLDQEVRRLVAAPAPEKPEETSD